MEHIKKTIKPEAEGYTSILINGRIVEMYGIRLRRVTILRALNEDLWAVAIANGPKYKVLPIASTYDGLIKYLEERNA